MLMPAPLLAQQATSQQNVERHYRVELVVVRHLAGVSDSAPQHELRDLTDVLDLYAPVNESAGNAKDAAPTAADAGLADGQLAEESTDERAAVRIDDMSDTMREAWRRLRSSSGFRPELFRAWERSGDGPFPQLRIHDDELLFEIDPAALNSGAQVDEHGALVFSDATIQRQHGSEAKLEPGEQPKAPPVQYYYRIDGTATLARTRFLHLNLDIELREPLYEPTATSSNPEAPLKTATELAEGYANNGVILPLSGSKIGPAAAATSFRIHRIAQRRQIKTEQMEYFDGPVIGVLVFVTGFDVTAENSMPVEQN